MFNAPGAIHGGICWDLALLRQITSIPQMIK
jgi:hypothetical protein